jgi:muconate cycloisomerase
MRTSTLIIARVDAIPVSLPLKKPVLMGGGQKFVDSDSLLVRIEAENGVVGWGEASSAPTFTGETLSGMYRMVQTVLAPLLIGRDALQRAMLERRLSDAIPDNTGAKAACNMALYDLLGLHLGVSVADLLGGDARDRLPVMRLLANPTVEEDIREAKAKAAEGFDLFKLKAGVKPIAEEVALMRALRDALPEARFCADANTGMTKAAAYEYVAAAAETNLLFLEQPFADDDLEGTVALARASAVPLCADESAHSVAHILAWHRAGAIGGANLKCIKFSGIAGVMRAALVCDALGLKVNLASKTGESSIGTAALVHLGYCVPNLEWGITPSTPSLAADLVHEPLLPSRGSMARPRGPGLGVRVDEAAVEKFRVAHPA